METEQSLTLGEYPYTYARVAAMKAKLLNKHAYDKVLKMKPAEIAKFLQDYEYKEAINKLGVRLSGSPLIEAALQENHVQSLNKLRRISQDGLQKLIEIYLKKEDIHNIKTILRGKFTKTSSEDIRKLLIPVGDLDIDRLNRLLSIDSIEKILEEVKYARYTEIQTALKSFKEKKTLEILEAAIDKIYFTKLIKFMNTLPEEAGIMKEFLGGELDSINIRIILNFKREKIGDEVIRNLMLISKASKLPRWRWERIITTKSFENLSKEFEKTPYEDIVKTSLDDLMKKGTLSQLDLKLQRHLLAESRKLSHQNPLSVDVILAYMFSKEIEIRNLHLISKSKQLGLGEEFIHKELIV